MIRSGAPGARKRAREAAGLVLATGTLTSAACNAISGVGDLSFGAPNPSQGGGAVVGAGGGGAGAGATGAGGAGEGGGGGGASVSSSSSSSSSASSSATGAGGAAGSGGVGGAPAVCGDGATDPPERCDDANTLPGDGCGATCLIENPDDCPGTPIALGPGSFVIMGDTTGANDTIQQSGAVGTCLNMAFAGPDLIYAITPSVDGTLTVTSIPMFDSHWLQARSACPAGQLLACDYSNNPGVPDMISLGVVAGATYTIGVDSYAGTSGTFTLTLELM